MSRNLYRLNQAKMTDAARIAIDLELELETIVPVESTKLERKLRDALNRICKLVPSIHRLQILDRIAMELDAEAGKASQVPTLGADAEGLAADALYLRRLEYDLTSMREAKATVQPKKEQTMKAGSKYETSQWPRGERP